MPLALTSSPPTPYTILTKFLKTEYSRFYPDSVQEEPEEEASPIFVSPTDMTAAFKEFITTEINAAPTPSSDLLTKTVEVFAKT